MISKISEIVFNKFEMGIGMIPYLYEMQIYLPKYSSAADTADIAKKFNSFCCNSEFRVYPYQAYPKIVKNHFGKKCSALLISSRKKFTTGEIFKNIDVINVSEILIEAYNMAESVIGDLHSVRLWQPLYSDSKKIANYINHNSDYYAHQEMIILARGYNHYELTTYQLPSLVIGSENK